MWLGKPGTKFSRARANEAQSTVRTACKVSNVWDSEVFVKVLDGAGPSVLSYTREMVGQVYGLRRIHGHAHAATRLSDGE